MRRERIIWIVALVVVAAAGFFGGQRFGTMRGGFNRAQGGQRAGAPNGAMMGGRGVVGTVTSVSADTVTVSGRDGTTTQVQLASNGSVRKQVAGQLSDIKSGDTIVVQGTQSGNVFQATSIQDNGVQTGGNTSNSGG